MVPEALEVSEVNWELPNWAPLICCKFQVVMEALVLEVDTEVMEDTEDTEVNTTRFVHFSSY